MAPTPTQVDPLAAALASFAARDDLTPAARDSLSLILAGSLDGFGVTDKGEIALSCSRLALMLGVSKSTLLNWRHAECGPPWVRCHSGSVSRVLYPVVAVQSWLGELSFGGSYDPDPAVLAAFGLEPRSQEAA